jgi:putative flippase GtrA
MSELDHSQNGQKLERRQFGGARGASLLQFIKFNLIGLINTAIDMVLFAVLVKLGVYYLAAQVIAYSAGMLNSLWMNSRFTFAAGPATAIRGGGLLARAGLPDAGTAVRFALWNGIVLALSLLMLAACKEWIGLNDVQAKIVVTGLSAVINFAGSKKWVFAARMRQGERS